MSVYVRSFSVPLLAGVLALGASGCISTESVERDVRARRANRYEAWRTEKERTNAQRPVLTGSLSLQDAIRAAVANSRQIQIAAVQRDVAIAKIVQAYSLALPQVNLGAAYTRLDKGAQGGIGQGDGPVDNYNLTATLTQPLYRGGGISAGIRGAKLFSMYADEQLRGTYQTTIFNARKAYYDVRLAMDLERASAEAVNVDRRNLEDVKKNFAAGTASSYDVLRAEVQLKTDIAQNVTDQNRYHVNLTTLFNTLGVSQESKVVVVDPLTYRPLSPTLDESVQAAYMQETDILQAELNIRVQMEALEYAKSGWYPQVNAVLQDLYGRPDPHNSFNNTSANSWNVGVQLVYPLFQGFSTAAQVKQARLGVDQAEIQLRDTEENVLLNLKQAMYNLEDAAKSIQAQQANVEQAEEALRLVELGYRQGVRKQVEVLDAQRAVTTAQASYAQALYSHETARLQYEQATGALSAPDGRFTAPFGVHSSPIRQLLDSDDNPASGTTKQAR